jgi:cellulose synthase/poly-beta-1,6-N-acetylglucosamine synthase-like glycosyltransferase
MQIFFIVFYLLILLLLSIYGANRYYTIYLFRKYKDKKVTPKGEFKKLPRVTVQLPIFNEKYVVERLIDRVVNIRYPRRLLEIQVLDDSTDDTTDIARRKCEEKRKQGYNIRYIHRATGRVSRPERSKTG